MRALATRGACSGACATTTSALAWAAAADDSVSTTAFGAPRLFRWSAVATEAAIEATCAAP